MFIDYMNFSNEARTVARLVAVTPRTSRPDVITNYLANHNNGEFARFYTVKVNIDIYKKDGTKVDADDLNAQDVLVTVDFNRDNTDLPLVVYLTGFPPENFKLAYRMQLEQND